MPYLVDFFPENKAPIHAVATGRNTHPTARVQVFPARGALY